MGIDMNRWVGIGRLTRGTDTAMTERGTAVTKFSIAVGDDYSANGKKIEKTHFFNCVAWGKTGELIAQCCHKGDRIGIEGKLQQRTWEKEGGKNSTVEIMVEKVYFLQNRKLIDSHNNSEPKIEMPDEEISF